MLSKNVRRARLQSRWRRAAIAALVVAVAPALSSMVPGEPSFAAPSVPQPTPMQRVTLGKAKTWPKAKLPKKAALFDASSHAVLPAAQDFTLTLPSRSAASSTPARVRAGSSPISVAAAAGTAPSRVRVRTADQKTAQLAGVRGVLFSVQSAAGAGTVDVNVDPSTFRNAFGGDYESRLHLVQLPACALTTPQLEKCQAQTPLTASTGSALATKVALAAPASSAAVVVVAATSDASGGGGDYTATSLSPGGTWSTSGNTGAFTYSYPVAVPPAIAGSAPDVDLSYDSASQDARTIGTNSQSSWVGDGWSAADNYVERSYESCDDVTGSGAPTGSGDLCWRGQVLMLSLNGASTPIVYDDDSHTFRLMHDSSTTKVENFTGTSGTSNGTDNGEYFRVTENGTQYYFGLNRLPGWTSGAEETKSALTVPVYKAHAGVNGCPDGSFADTACTLGYRFNLDYVVDRNGNAMAYYYTPETGYYGADAKDTAVSYVRASTLKRIDYGVTASTLYTTTAPEQIVFTTDERCTPGEPAGNTCDDSQFTVSHPEYWPDAPVDLNCTAGKDCTIHAPSFWSRRLLTTITTLVQVGGATKQVDRYDLAHSFPDNGDHAPTLWLQSITRTGLDRLGGAGADASGGTVTFYPSQMANRVGTLPGLPRMYYQRLTAVVTETGAETDIVYNTPDCSSVPASDPSDANDTKAQAFASINTTGCFPVYWTPEAQPQPLIDWFYTHTVASVTTTDNNNHFQDGTKPELVTQYAYKGAPGWHYDDNELVKAKNRTWGQFRGYPEVDVTGGDPRVFHYTDHTQVFDQQTLTKTYYFLGMDGDTLPGGKTRTVGALTSTDGSVSVPDKPEFAGQVLEADNYTGTGGTIDNTSVSVPVAIGPTASRKRAGLPTLQSSMLGVAKAVTREKVSYGWRRSEIDTFYDTTLGRSTTGMPVQRDDRGEVGAAGNVTTCTFTRYLDGTSSTVVLPAEVITTDQDCTSANSAPSGSLMSDVRTSYDSQGFGYDGDGQSNPPKPTKGNPTLVQTASVGTGAAATTFIDTSSATYDSYGRVTTATRTPHSSVTVGSTTTSLAQNVYTRFSPATGALPSTIATITEVTPGTDCSAVTKSSKDCQLSSVTLDPARQLRTSQTDVAGWLTSADYDALGRTAAVWLPNQAETLGAKPNTTYGYTLSATGPNVVTTNQLVDNDDPNAPATYNTSTALYDAMLRPLETQATGENGSLVVSDVQYDSHGWTVLTNNSYAVSASPSGQLISDHLSQVSVPSTTVTDHNAMGDVTQSTEEHNASATWYTRMAYTGDKTTVLPPTGAVATTKTVNVRDQVTELDQDSTPPTLTGTITGGFTATGGTAQSTSYGYDAAGRQTTVTGPDKAVWSYTYDLLGRTTSQTDPDTRTSYTNYDDAGNVILTQDARGIQLAYTYDLLGRKLTALDKTKSWFQYASWTYDTLRIGKLTSSTRYVSGVAGGYTVAVTGYSTLGNPLGQRLTLPGTERPLPQSYTTTFSYTPHTEQVAQQTDPAVGGLPGESITYGHDLLGAPTKTSGADLYVAGTTYTDFAQPSKIAMGDSTNEADTLYSYDEQTLRLIGRTVQRTQAPGPVVDNTTYSYDDAGNPLSLTDQQSETGTTITDNQCYRYDGLGRLIQAWTAADSCPPAGTTQPTAATVAAGAGAYWQSYTYDAVGERTRLVDHSVTGDTDLTTDYTNGCTSDCANVTQPHTLTATSGGADPTTFAYDADGNLRSRMAHSGNNQTLKWDDEGHLAEVDATGNSTTVTKYLYDADGNQLIRRDPGQTTLFTGDTEVVINTAVTPAASLGAVRTYNHGGDGPAVAVRSTLPGGGTAYLLDDPVGTATLAMDTTTQQISRQQNKPYGDPRTSANITAWPDPTHGYLGVPKDVSTGYTDTGARKYDPILGRFISVDPVLEATDPNQLGGYTYAGDNPLATSDPSGQCPKDYCDGYGQYTKGSPQNGYTPDPPRSKPNNRDRNQDPAELEVNGYGQAKLGGATVTADQVNNINKFALQVNYAYYFFRASMGKDWDDLDDNTKLLKMMDWACEQQNSVCTTVYANTIKQAIDGKISTANGLDPEHSSRISDAAAMDGQRGGATSEEEGRILASSRVSAQSYEDVEDLAADAKSVACVVKPNSFSPETRVLMADGTTKPIAEVQVGDKVRATDPETGTTSAQEVTQLHVNTDTELVDLKVDTPAGRATVVHTTQEHPFWDPNSQQWVNAGDLQPGEPLDAAMPHRQVTVKAVRHFTGLRAMYNLTVDNVHTYYVLAGNTPVLVHNDGGDDGTLRRDDLTPGQRKNLTRYERKLPAGAEPTAITRGADGVVQFEAKVPGRVPGSYANYTKTVDPSGETIGYTKTTIVPDGSVAHVKDKMVGGC